MFTTGIDQHKRDSVSTTYHPAGQRVRQVRLPNRPALTISPRTAGRVCPQWCVAATALVTRRAIREHSASDRWTGIVDGPDVITKLGVRSRMRKHR